MVKVSKKKHYNNRLQLRNALLIFKKLYKNYWKFGFKSYLYDLLTPSAYLASLQWAVENIKSTPEDLILDMGCGTGQALGFLKPDIKRGVRYIGLDLLKAGLDRTKSKTNGFDIEKNVFCIQADFSRKIPIKAASIDFLICHFSLYTIYDTNARINLMNDLFNLIKPGGMVVITNPSKSYNPNSIIYESVRLDKNSKGVFVRLIRKWFLNPLAKILGLNFIHSQLKSGQWKWFSLKEMKDEISQAGFVIVSTKEVYGQSGYLVVAKKS